MDQTKTGQVIKDFRTKLGLTQKGLAERINVSDKAVSKWERGNGCPDVSLLPVLSKVFGTDIQILLTGEIDRKESEKGNMKKLKYYVCGECGNIITATSDASVTCCGNKLTALEPREAKENEKLKIEETDGELFVSAEHPMTKEHYISFAAYQNERSVMLFKQYPEWGVQFTLPILRSGIPLWRASGRLSRLTASSMACRGPWTVKPSSTTRMCLPS